MKIPIRIHRNKVRNADVMQLNEIKQITVDFYWAFTVCR